MCTTKKLPELFGSMVFNEETMKARLSDQAYHAWKECVTNGAGLDAATADEIAECMKQWAVEKGATISALIFSKSGLFETQGTVESKDGSKTAIVLYEGSDKDDRHAVRYQVNISGTVDQITRQGEKLSGGFEIHVLNMSSIGLLLLAPEGMIQEGDIIRFAAITKGQRIIITAHAARVGSHESGEEKIGCTIQFVNLG